ncbi:MAG: FAD-dependent oxidoreductase [Evtepia sp.]
MYEKLQTPGQIGTLTIKNRIVMTAASCSLSEPDGRMTEDILAFYERRAIGGVGLIITEMTCVDETHGVLFPRELSAARDENIPEFQTLATRVHKYGTKIFAQLFHPGSNADPNLNELPLFSADSGEIHGTPIRAMTKEELLKLVAQFGTAALRIKQSGFDGIEIHAAHNYLIQSFLSPVTNHRTDEFACHNRMHLLELIVCEIRRTCGDFPLMVRVSLEEYIGKEGYHADVGVKICQTLEALGVDAINVSASGTSSKLSQSVEPINFMQGWRKHLAKAVKSCVSIPVCSVALVRDPAFAEELLRDGYTDFVGTARSHLADPDWANKAFCGRDSEIIRCIGCMSCFQRYPQIGHISCALNPETGYEATLPPTPHNGDNRLVVVLGAGPAGMESAYRAAKRGFHVKLYEKNPFPGGQLALAAYIPRKEKMKWFIDVLQARCESESVELLFDKAPSLEELAALHPYAILDATGARPLIPPSIEGAIGNPIVCTPPDIIRGDIDPRGESVVIVGSGMTGLELAESLCDRDHNNAIVVMEAANQIAPGVFGSNRNAVTALLEINNVVFMLNRKLTRIGSDRIWFSDVTTGEEFVYPCDRVLLSLGVEPSRPYGDALMRICQNVTRIGDAERPNGIWTAVHDAYRSVARL